jgi:hypothetical protein
MSRYLAWQARLFMQSLLVYHEKGQVKEKAKTSSHVGFDAVSSAIPTVLTIAQAIVLRMVLASSFANALR